MPIRDTADGKSAPRALGRAGVVLCAGLVGGWMGLSSFTAHGHDSPEHVAEALTARMAASGTNAEILWERATEYRALGRLSSAAHDLTQAAELRPEFTPALADLARVELALGRPESALETINRALRRTADESGRAPLLMIRAEIHQARGNVEDATADCTKAFRVAGNLEPDWYLTRAQLEAGRGRFKEAAEGLRAGLEQTGNAVLEAEWIDAMLDAGEQGQVLPLIEAELVASRCQSSWLLRRARARLAVGQGTAARGDLHAAISEINERLSPVRPEPTLLAERGLAYALLGDKDSAQQDLNAVRRHGSGTAAFQRLERMLAAPRQAVSTKDRRNGQNVSSR